MFKDLKLGKSLKLAAGAGESTQLTISTTCAHSREAPRSAQVREARGRDFQNRSQTDTSASTAAAAFHLACLHTCHFPSILCILGGSIFPKRAPNSVTSMFKTLSRLHTDLVVTGISPSGLCWPLEPHSPSPLEFGDLQHLWHATLSPLQAPTCILFGWEGLSNPSHILSSSDNISRHGL